jgi:glycyl-tRNA synthetase alpha chain
LKPAPVDAQELYLKSLSRLGIDPKVHDIRFVEDDWESPTLGAWGLGWQVELDGIEITQFTYFQQMGGLDLKIIPVELTYGLERIAMFLEGVESIFDIHWDRQHTWGELYKEHETDFSRFNFELSDPEFEISQFNKFEAEAERLLKLGLLYPGYDYVVKCSHIFNILEARGGISVSERTNYITRVRRLARLAAELYLDRRSATD